MESSLIVVVVLVRARGGVKPARVWKWRRRERLASVVANVPARGISEGKRCYMMTQQDRGSVSEMSRNGKIWNRKSSKWPYTRPMALCSPRSRLKIPEEIDEDEPLTIRLSFTVSSK